MPFDLGEAVGHATVEVSRSMNGLNVTRLDTFSKPAIIKHLVDYYGCLGSPGQSLNEITHTLVRRRRSLITPMALAYYADGVR